MVNAVELDNPTLRKKYALKQVSKFYKNVTRAIKKINKNPDDIEKIVSELSPSEADAFYGLRQIAFEGMSNEEFQDAGSKLLIERANEIYAIAYAEPVHVRETKTGQIKVSGIHGDWRVKPSKAKHLENHGDWRVSLENTSQTETQEQTVATPTKASEPEEIAIPPEFQPLTAEEKKQIEMARNKTSFRTPTAAAVSLEEAEKAADANLERIRQRKELHTQMQHIGVRQQGRFQNRLPNRYEPATDNFLSAQEEADLADIRESLKALKPKPNKKRGIIAQTMGFLNKLARD